MLPGGRLIRTLFAVGALVFCATVFRAQAKADSTGAPFIADGLGKGAVSLDGPWQFHLGDNVAWAKPETNDAAGQDGWEQITAGKPWGLQGHKGYTGYAWYRKRITITLAPGASPDVALYLPQVSDACEVYWNGELYGAIGKLPPHPVWYYLPAPETMGLGQARSGVLAIRVWKAALSSNDSDVAGGFPSTPFIGSPGAIGALKAANTSRWLIRIQARILLDAFYLFVGLIALVAWLRNREQWLLFWVAASYISVVICESLEVFRFQVPFVVSIDLTQPLFAVINAGTWYILVLLLRLDEIPMVRRGIRAMTILAFVICAIDSVAIYTLQMASGRWVARMQGVDWVMTAIFGLEQLAPIPIVLWAVFRRRRLPIERWVVAFSELLLVIVPVTQQIASQSNRFIAAGRLVNLLLNPVFIVNGAVVSPQTFTASLLLFAIAFAVYRNSRDEHRRQIAVEQEFKSARELQQVLIPEQQPKTPGYALTSSYKPASEVGGDFFQVIALKDDATLIVLGDVSGKGLKAAMAVALIVGMVRALAHIFPEPGKLLEELNDRLAGRLHGALATALALRLDPRGRCTLASAGHLSPFVNEQELELPGALPLGISAEVVYEDIHIQLKEGDHLALYTDGLLEARNATGELYGFERLHTLFTSRPNADQVSEAAIGFGQDDDITVLTLTKLGVGKASAPQPTVPILSPA